MTCCRYKLLYFVHVKYSEFGVNVKANLVVMVDSPSTPGVSDAICQLSEGKSDCAIKLISWD